MTFEELTKTLESFDSDREYRISKAFPDGGLGNLSARLQRAAINQMEQGPSMLSRYGIWANTVRDHIREAAVEFDKGDVDKGHRLLRKAANSLSAFSEIQGKFNAEEVQERLKQDKKQEDDN